MVVGHVHHHLREEASEDMAFCQEMAQRYALPFAVKQIRVRELARKEGLSLETAARNYRYQALEEMAGEMQCADIALGHTADDQAETILSHFLRGSGVRGLAGIPFRNGRRVRPILTLYRHEILDYLRQCGETYRVDESNRDLRYRRNLIRHRLLPQLTREFNPNLPETLNRIAEIHQQVEHFLDFQAQIALAEITKVRTQHKIVLDIDRFWRYFTIVRKYILRNALEALSGKLFRPDFAALSRIEDLISRREIGRRLPLQGKWEVLIDHDGFVLWDGHWRRFNLEIKPGQSAVLDSKRILSISEKLPVNRNVKKVANTYNQYIDADQIQGVFRVRNVKSGDRYKPLGLGGHKKVLDLLSDRKVPLHLRPEVPVLIYGDEIVWVVGFQINENFKITDQTRQMLHLQIKEVVS